MEECEREMNQNDITSQSQQLDLFTEMRYSNGGNKIWDEIKLRNPDIHKLHVFVWICNLLLVIYCMVIIKYYYCIDAHLRGNEKKNENVHAVYNIVKNMNKYLPFALESCHRVHGQLKRVCWWACSRQLQCIL